MPPHEGDKLIRLGLAEDELAVLRSRDVYADERLPLSPQGLVARSCEAEELVIDHGCDDRAHELVLLDEAGQHSRVC